ncbi:MAG: trigger factor [Candidatus Nitronauta litoralis]|uniref:Trigger factor n=1 Tax=Candidatus Nitronauta litoralis TaxID=2705533 RepID=A0A7T0BZ19_9BACT|nr:MAG: trigger factor [Candidatus Nitronauta litoralis]
MELKVEEIDQVRRKLLIKVPEDVVSDKVKKSYQKMNQQVKMPGFRPGKIPMKILEKQVPLEAMTQLWQDLMQEYYEKALADSGIVPAGPPEIDHDDIKGVKKDEPFSFSVLVDIKPDTKFKDYKGIKIKKYEHSVTEAELQASIDKHLEQFGTFEIMDESHKAEAGDFVVMDFEGFFEGDPLDNGSARDYPVKIGDKKMIPGFEDQLIGHTCNEEFDVRVKLPENWNNKVRRVSMPIPGKDQDQNQDMADFKVKIKEIKKQVLPELTDELVQGQGEDSVKSFKAKLRAQIQGMKDQTEEMKLKQDIFDQLVENNDITVPESMVKQEIKFMIEGAKYQIMQSGMSLEDSGFDESQAEKEWNPRATHNAKGYLILDGIANQENIHVSQEDMDEEYNRLAQETGKKVEDVKERLFANAENMNQTTQRVRGQKTLNFIYSHCEFEYVKSDKEKADAEIAQS